LCRRALARGWSSAAYFGDPASKEATLGLCSGEFQRSFERGPCLVGSTEPSQQVRARGVEVLVAVQLEPVDEREARFRPVRFGDSDRAI
jgi:hypothetical protein